MKNSKVLIVGGINMDMVVGCSRLPLVGESMLVDDIRIIPGGKGANQAVACSLLGAQSYILGRVGDDVYVYYILGVYFNC